MSMLAKKNAQQQKGFTLIELVASMVVTALAFTALANFFFNTTSQAIDPIFETRAAKLGEALMDEILSRPYDDATAPGGTPACGAVGGANCTAAADLGAEVGEISRDLFDDVDDYNDYCARRTIEDALGNEFGDGNSLEDFDRFEMSICVYYDGDFLNVTDGTGADGAKLIVINIYPPSAGGNGPAIEFKAYRANF